jgi:hypothetical protein
MADPEIAVSVMIPNYNYAKYIGTTIDSVLADPIPGLEIVVADNASTDHSVDVVRAFADPRIRVEVNPCNVGFAPNLERVAAMARGRRMILLSSDDRMLPGALSAYQRLETALGARAELAVWGTTATVIDGDGHPTGSVALDPKQWRDARDEPELSAAVGYPVRSCPAAVMLRRSLELLRAPLVFATTCYSRVLHDRVGGYSGGRVINPDKWFLWKLLGEAETIYAIDAPLFEYRVHAGGQGPQEQASGALKHLTDEYTSTFAVTEAVLAKACLERTDLARAFIEQDITLRGLLALARGQRVTASRYVHFGLATYPHLMRENPKAWLLRSLLLLGPVGTQLARAARGRAESAWRQRESEHH